MYTWGYIKENTLSKLDLDETAANELGLVSKFIYYANEAMTMICSSIFADEKFATIEAEAGMAYTMPDDFISFSNDVATLNGDEAYDDVLVYVGYNKVKCLKSGVYEIPYNARWFFFEKDMDAKTIVTAPNDICDALPSYIASQCFKIDNEAKAAIYRNEFEMLCARIDNTTFSRQRTVKIGGGWLG